LAQAIWAQAILTQAVMARIANKGRKDCDVEIAHSGS